MTVWINGERADAGAATNLAELAQKYGLRPNTVLIEYNGGAILQREWEGQTLSEGDRIEFVRVVAGG